MPSSKELGFFNPTLRLLLAIRWSKLSFMAFNQTKKKEEKAQKKEKKRKKKKNTYKEIDQNLGPSLKRWLTPKCCAPWGT